MPSRSGTRHPDRASLSLAGKNRARLIRLCLALLYLSALSMLILWEYREHLEVLSSECSLKDVTKPSLYNIPYSRILEWSSSHAAGHVATVVIPAELEEIHSNLCLGRAYMADVLRVLATEHPTVIAIDKFYSPNACASDPASTESLLRAVDAVPMPVVVGESTNGLEKRAGGSCLARKAQLDFHSPNVRHGITRIDSEPERFPLRWLVLTPDRATNTSAEPAHPEASSEEVFRPELADSLSLAAVRAYDPAFVAQPRVQRLIAKDDHAYANLSTDLPRITTTDLLCSAADETTRRRWSVSCSGNAAPVNLAGRLVVVGAETSTDEKIVLEKRMWGVQLQAHYMEALLSGDYLRYLPLPAGFTLFALFVFLIEGLPTILLARRPRWKGTFLIGHAYPRRRYFWVVFCTVALLAASTVLSLALRYLPPLLVFGDILLVATTRFLFFLAESAEHPFLHAYTHGKAHSMSQNIPDARPVVVTANKTDPSPTPTPQTPPQPLSILPEPVQVIPGPISGNTPGSEGGSAG